MTIGKGRNKDQFKTDRFAVVESSRVVITE